MVLARAVGAPEGLFVQQAGQALFLGHHAQHLHHQLVAVAVHIGNIEYRSQLVLGRGSLVVFALGRNTQFPQSAVHFMHEIGNADADASAVVVVQLLGLGGLGAEEGAAGVDEVPAL